MKMDNEFFDKVASLIEQARSHIGRTVDLTMCISYYEIGRMIVEEEQGGETRAKYGCTLLAELSRYLNARFGRGFSETNLKSFRKFYQTYAPSIRQTASVELEKASSSATIFAVSQKGQTPSAEFYPFKLSWSHYQILIRMKTEQERKFYEIEAAEQQWSVRQLSRQYNSSLYERLALSRDKDEVIRLANEGQTIEKPRDMLKNPLVLEFLDLHESDTYTETDLESSLNTHLQKFLLELGKGFLFEARQKRFTFDEQSFFIDLVFYNRLLQCYVLIDLKTERLQHQDLGQMQMYVHYFDRYVKKDFERPTVGILLCREKSDSIVEMTLPEGENIYASEYNLYLPDKTLLQQKLNEWTQEFEEVQEVLALARETADDE
jgi:predicted nuclease of restriction endonuclease-like (RecB) superfamily